MQGHLFAWCNEYCKSHMLEFSIGLTTSDSRIRSLKCFLFHLEVNYSSFCNLYLQKTWYSLIFSKNTFPIFGHRWLGPAIYNKKRRVVLRGTKPAVNKCHAMKMERNYIDCCLFSCSYHKICCFEFFFFFLYKTMSRLKIWSDFLRNDFSLVLNILGLYKIIPFNFSLC